MTKKKTKLVIFHFYFILLDLQSSGKNGVLSSEKGDFNFFTPKESIKNEDFEKLTDEDFEEAVKNAVKTIKQMSTSDNVESEISNIAENVTKSLREFKGFKGSPAEKTKQIATKLSDLSSPESVFKEVVSELFSNPNEKFTIGSRNTQTQNSKKHPNSGKLSPKSSKHAPACAAYFNYGKSPTTPTSSAYGQQKLGFSSNFNFLGTTSNEAVLSTQMNSLKIQPNATLKDNEALQSHLLNMRSGFKKLKEMLNSDNPSLQLEATKGFRQMISIKRDAVSQELIKKEIIPILLQFLKKATFPALQVEALWALTNLAAGSSEQTQLLIKHNAVPILVDLLKSNNREILEQTVWVLGNIAGDDVTARDSVLKAGALPLLLSWMNCCVDPKVNGVLRQERVSHHSSTEGINAPTPLTQGFESAMDSEYPDFNCEPLRSSQVDGANLFPQPDSHAFSNMQFNGFGNVRVLPNYKNFLKIASWTLSNLCDGQPRPDIEIHSILKTVRTILFTIDDAEVLSHVCWALSHLCDGSSLYIEQVVRSQICVKLVNLLKNKAWRVVKPALRTVGNIVCAEDEQDYTQHILDCGAIPLLTKLIQHPHKEIQKEACWTISNISAGTVDQIQFVLDSGAIPQLVRLANSIDLNANRNVSKKSDAERKNGGSGLVRKGQLNNVKKKSDSGPTKVLQSGQVDPDVRIEACWVLLNATSCGSEKQIVQLVREGCVQVLCSLLADASMVLMALEGIEKVLQVGQVIGRKIIEPIVDVKNMSGDQTERESRERKKSKGKKKNQDKIEVNFNPHALLLDTPKIEALQQHRSTAIAKRAKRIWKSHFVDCAICHKAFSKHANVAEFCQECKCYVCESCNCSVFHLSYQDKIWKDLIDDEEKNSKKEKNPKKDKSKRQKKREKDRKRKLLLKEKARITQEKEQVKPQQKKISEKKLLKVKQVSSKSKDTPKKNEQYVDFLLQNGSIMELWNMMNENEETVIKSQDSKHKLVT